MVTEDEVADPRAGGAIGEMPGHCFDTGGHPVATGCAGRARSPAVEELRNRMSVAVAGGGEKVEALRAVPRSGPLEGLITDEATGRRLVAGEPETAAPKPRAP